MTESTTAQTTTTAAVVVDTSGLLCPLPVYKAGLALKNLADGDILELICTDPGSLADIPAMARQRGDRLVSTDDRGDVQVFLIEKGGAR